MRRGLLLGAGFSVELGMPTSKEFSQAFFSFLTPKKLKGIIDIRKSYEPFGKDNPTDKNEYDNFYISFMKYLSEGNLNYEELIRIIDDVSGYERAKQLAKDDFLVTLRTLINESFFIFQTQTYPIYQLNKGWYRQLLSDFAEQELWIYSLNHDVIIEMLCKDLGFDLYVGGNKTLQLPFNNLDSKRSITFTEVNNVESNLDNLHFAKNSKGINLIKLHGGINEFTYDEERKRLFVLPLVNETSEEYLLGLRDLLHKPHYFHNGRPIHTGSEIVIGDTDGEMQFLSPSILSGSRKYSPTIDDRKGEEKMAFFSNGIEIMDELYVIGYGFGDEHINNRIVRAMHLNEKMKIWVVDPYNTKQGILNAFDYDLRVRGINANTTQAISFIINDKWLIGDKETSLELVSTERSKIYDRLYNVNFKRG